jgi:integrase
LPSLKLNWLNGRTQHAEGKGRKERICPLWPESVVLLKNLLERQGSALALRKDGAVRHVTLTIFLWFGLFCLRQII